MHTWYESKIGSKRGEGWFSAEVLSMHEKSSLNNIINAGCYVLNWVFLTTNTELLNDLYFKHNSHTNCPVFKLNFLVPGGTFFFTIQITSRIANAMHQWPPFVGLMSMLGAVQGSILLDCVQSAQACWRCTHWIAVDFTQMGWRKNTTLSNDCSSSQCSSSVEMKCFHINLKSSSMLKGQ